MESTQATSGMATGAQKIHSGAVELKNAAMDRAVELKDAAIEKGSHVVKRGHQAALKVCDDTEGMIKEYPFRSVLIAFGVGAVIGAILMRNNNNR